MIFTVQELLSYHQLLKITNPKNYCLETLRIKHNVCNNYTGYNCLSTTFPFHNEINVQFVINSFLQRFFMAKNGNQKEILIFQCYPFRHKNLVAILSISKRMNTEQCAITLPRIISGTRYIFHVAKKTPYPKENKNNF